MGGHGREYSEVRDVSTRAYASGRICTVRSGSKLYDYPGGLAIGTVRIHAWDRPRVGLGVSAGP